MNERTRREETTMSPGEFEEAAIELFEQYQDIVNQAKRLGLFEERQTVVFPSSSFLEKLEIGNIGAQVETIAIDTDGNWVEANLTTYKKVGEKPENIKIHYGMTAVLNRRQGRWSSRFSPVQIVLSTEGIVANNKPENIIAAHQYAIELAKKQLEELQGTAIS